jgi:Rps23 Pro-64 3,4-dihydroxylase Tpa1-like proline 4-hydroxylase
MNNIIIKESVHKQNIEAILEKCTDWIQCDLGINDSRNIDLSLRNSLKCVINWNNYINISELNFTDVYLTRFEILKYTVGSFFKEHTDNSSDKNSLGVLLYIVPSDDLEGGELIINEQINSFKTPHFVYIPIGVPHEVLVIKKGIRIVFKAYVNKKIISHFRFHRYSNSNSNLED